MATMSTPGSAHAGPGLGVIIAGPKRVVALCVVAAAALLAGILADPGVRDESYYLLALSALTVIPAIAFRPPGMDLATFIVLTPVLLCSLDTFLLRLGLYNISTYHNETWPPVLTDEYVRKAAWLALGGNAALWVGYSTGVGRFAGSWAAGRLRRHIQNQDVGPNKPLVLAAFCLGIVVRLYCIGMGISGYFSDAGQVAQASSYIQFLSQIENVGTLALLLYACVLLKQPRANWKPFLVMFGVELATVVLLGFKGAVAYRFFYLAVVFALVRRRFPWKIALMGSLALIAVFPINMIARTNYHEGKFRSGDLSSIGSGVWGGVQDGLQGDSVGGFVLDNFEKIARASAYLEPLAMVVQYADETGTCWYGVDYLFPVFVFIPRAVWPSKPTGNHGLWVYQEVYGNSEGMSAQTQTVPGDFYLNFGTAGVIVGLLVFGAVGRAVSVVILEVTSIRYLPMIPYVIHGFGLPGADMGVHFAGLLIALVFYGVVLHVLVPGRRARMAAVGRPGPTW